MQQDMRSLCHQMSFVCMSVADASVQ